MLLTKYLKHNKLIQLHLTFPTVSGKEPEKKKKKPITLVRFRCRLAREAKITFQLYFQWVGYLKLTLKPNSLLTGIIHLLCLIKSSIEILSPWGPCPGQNKHTRKQGPVYVLATTFFSKHCSFLFSSINLDTFFALRHSIKRQGSSTVLRMSLLNKPPSEELVLPLP